MKIAGGEGGRGGICALLILSLVRCRISSERHTDCVFQRRVPTSIQLLKIKKEGEKKKFISVPYSIRRKKSCPERIIF